MCWQLARISVGRNALCSKFALSCWHVRDPLRNILQGQDHRQQRDVFWTSETVLDLYKQLVCWCIDDLAHHLASF